MISGTYQQLFQCKLHVQQCLGVVFLIQKAGTLFDININFPAKF